MSTMTVEQTFNAAEAIEATGATYRQMDYWSRCGLLGPAHERIGSGGRRCFTTADLEVLAALVDLRAVGCNSQAGPGRERLRQSALEAAVAAVRARPVSPAGEWLIVSVDPPTARRFDRYLLDDLTERDAPLWAVRLRSLSTSATPAGEGVPAAASPVGLGAVGRAAPTPPFVPATGGSTP